MWYLSFLSILFFFRSIIYGTKDSLSSIYVVTTYDNSDFKVFFYLSALTRYLFIFFFFEHSIFYQCLSFCLHSKGDALLQIIICTYTFVICLWTVQCVYILGVFLTSMKFFFLLFWHACGCRWVIEYFYFICLSVCLSLSVNFNFFDYFFNWGRLEVRKKATL